LEGERSKLFYEILRLSKEIQPKFIFLENVPAITSRGGLRVTQEIASLGYDCRWCIISAASIGALHKRERWFLLAHARSDRGRADASGYKLSTKSTELQRSDGEACTNNDQKICRDVSDAKGQECARLSKREEKGQSSIRICGKYESIDDWQEAVSSICRTTDGIPNRVDRIRALGNSVVPWQAREAFRILSG
jgi:DNA (cytosine-5)-methyltransferase 1